MLEGLPALAEYQQVIPYVAGGVAAAIAVAGPAEWWVHRNILHNRDRPNASTFIENASREHNDIHHGAFRAPHHYYRDITNEHATIHFATSHIGLIARVGALLGGTISGIEVLASYATPLEPFSLIQSVGVVAGTTLGSMIAYGLYESLHHYMHVVGERRLQIGRIFGDYAEEGRTGNLRLPKPTLDSLCDTIDDRLDGKKGVFRLRENCEQVLAGQNITKNMDDMLKYTLDTLREWESGYLAAATPKEIKIYNTERAVHRWLRSVPLFESLDHHHFIHHSNYGNNLNVVWMWWDHVVKTKKDSSEEALTREKRYWLCPNSPDEKKFEVKEKPKKKPSAVQSP